MRARDRQTAETRSVCYLGNAATVHLLKMANYFAERYWKVTLITWRAPRTDVELHRDITVHRIKSPPHSVALCPALIEVAVLMKRIHADIVHAHYLGHFGILAGLYGRVSGYRPLIVSAWGSDVLTEARGAKRLLIRYALRQVDCVHSDAYHLQGALNDLGVENTKLRIVHFGVDTRKFRPGKVAELCHGGTAARDTPVVISLRNLRPVYDVASLVSAIPLVKQVIPYVRFTIAGQGPEEKRLKLTAQALGVTDSVDFIGFVPNDELPGYLAVSDVYVSTSLSDAGLAASTAEAMACRLPVIVTDFGDNSKWVENGVNGFVVPLSDPQALADKIIYLLRNNAERIRMGQAGRKVIEERNDYHKEMAKMERIYEELIERYRK